MGSGRGAAPFVIPGPAKPEPGTHEHGRCPVRLRSVFMGSRFRGNDDQKRVRMTGVLGGIKKNPHPEVLRAAGASKDALTELHA
jgi:hypothetical protein